MSTQAERALFIEKIAPLIQAEAKARGYKLCSPIIAQAICESNFGLSSLSKNWHNYFGMKCGSSWKGPSVNLKTKEEYTKGTLTTIRDNFRVYSSMEEGVKGYFDFISTKRYAKLKDCATPKEYLEAIKVAGYATSSSYVNTNMNFVNTYGLEKYDWNTGQKEKCPYKLSVRLVKRGSKGQSVGWVQWHLVKLGYNLKTDQIYGPKTELAVILFQKSRNIACDGKAGPMTLALLERAI